MSLEAPHDHYTRRLLSEVEAGNGVSQRRLARQAGIALGLTNLLLKRLARKGWIRLVRVKPNRVRYLITPAGLSEKARMSGAYLTRSMRFYAEARERILARFEQVSREWPGGAGDRKRIIFFGAGEVAEIGFVCLQYTDLELVAVVSGQGPERFCGMPVVPVADARDGRLGPTFDKVLVMSFAPTDELILDLAAANFPDTRVVWL